MFLYIVLIVILILIVFWRTIYYKYVTDDLVAVMQTKKVKYVKECPICKGEIKGVRKGDSKLLSGHCDKCDIHIEADEMDWEVNDVKLRFKGMRFLAKLKVIFWYQWLRHMVGKKRARYFNSKSAHITTICIHTVVCVMFYTAFRKMIGDQSAFLASALFAIHPFNTEVSVWLSGKNYGVTAFLVLLGWTIPFLAPFIFLSAPYLAFTIVPAPLVFLLSPYPAVALMAGITFYVRRKFVFNSGEAKGALYCYKEEAWAIKPRKLIIATKFYGYYFVQSFLGLKCATYSSYLEQYLVDPKVTEDAYKKPDRYFFIGVLVVGLLVSLSIWGRHSPLFFGLVWWTLCIAPFCNFVSTGNMLVTQRYAYLANIGIMIAVSQIPYGYILFPWYLARVFDVMAQYREDWFHTEFATIEEPHFYMSWVRMANKHFAQGGNGVIPLKDLATARDCNPHSFKVWYNMSSCFISMYDIKNAIFALERAKKYVMLGQEQSRQNFIRDHEELIGKMYMAQQLGKRLDIAIEKISFVV